MNEEEKILKSAARWFYLLILFLGIAFYLSWAILYEDWLDPAVYGVSISMIMVGIFGVAIYFRKNEE